MRRRTAVLVLAGVSVFTGCSPFGKRAGADLIRGARAAYATIPPYPGATEISHSEDTARAGDGSGPVTGGGVLHVFRLPRGTSVHAVATFYRRRLAEHGWSLRETLPGLPDHRAGPVLNFRRGRDDASVNLEGGYDHELELGVVERAERPS